MAMKYGRRGFTLIEILVALALIAMAAGLAFVNLHRPVAKANSRVVADQVGEFLRRARNRAQKEARPVAVVLPNKGGSASVCQSVAELDGPVNPIITRVKDFSGEHPETVLFIGTYDASGVWSIDPPQPGNSGYYAQGLGSLPALAPINDWVGGNANNLLVFLPDGTVLGNDLPHLNGDYKIVVSQGAVTGGGAAQGNGIMDVSPTLHGLTAASDPYTVSVSALGVVTVTKGVDQATSVALSEKPLALGSPAPALLPDAKTTVNPQILELSVRPSAGFMKGAYGLDQILHPSRQLSLTVSAKQSNDEELFCEFFMSSGSGQFSVSGVQKMYYQPYFPPFLEAGWRSTVQWSPPPGAVAGQAFTVDAVVTSSRGGSATTEGNTSLRKVIYTYDKGRIYFSGLSAVTDLEEIYSVRADGTDLRKVTYQDTPDIVQRFPAGARDGHKLLYTQIDTLTTRSSIYAQTGRGGLTTRITDKGIFPSLSDDSTVMVYQWTQGLVPGSPQRPYTASPDLPA
ncbi:MAG: type II secretion system protein, partial [Rhodobacterales bacterium]|nr:type II secretion system protein [Rhodobacterales bacterium]